MGETVTVQNSEWINLKEIDLRETGMYYGIILNWI
jgi:hypothetical protein